MANITTINFNNSKGKTDSIKAVKIDSAENTPEIDLYGEIMIIPNGAYPYDLSIGLSFTKRAIKGMAAIAEANGVEYNPETTRAVETWWCCPELDCDNFADHYPQAVDANGKQYWIQLPCRRDLPETLLKNFREGEKITVKIPVNLISMEDYCNRDWDEDKCPKAMLNVIFLPDQLNKRYRHRGPFEECLRYVCNA